MPLVDLSAIADQLIYKGVNALQGSSVADPVQQTFNQPPKLFRTLHENHPLLLHCPCKGKAIVTNDFYQNMTL